jgi:hypothetical protein
VEQWQRELFNRVLESIPKIRRAYDRDQVLELFGAIFDVEYPSGLFRDQMAKEDADVIDHARGLAKLKAAAFVEKNLNDWFDAIVLILVMIGRREGEMQMFEYIAEEGLIPKDTHHHSVSGYKRSAKLLTAALINHLDLSKNKGGRRKDEALMNAIEAAFADLSRSEVTVGQEGIENYLRRKTGKAITYEAAGKRLNRKGKTVSAAKGKKRKSRKGK